MHQRRYHLEPLASEPAIPAGNVPRPSVYRKLLHQHDVSGDVHYGIPFSVAEGKRVQRGVIGCLVVTPSLVT